MEVYRSSPGIERSWRHPSLGVYNVNAPKPPPAHAPMYLGALRKLWYLNRFIARNGHLYPTLSIEEQSVTLWEPTKPLSRLMDVYNFDNNSRGDSRSVQFEVKYYQTSCIIAFVFVPECLLNLRKTFLFWPM